MVRRLRRGQRPHRAAAREGRQPADGRGGRHEPPLDRRHRDARLRRRPRSRLTPAERVRRRAAAAPPGLLQRLPRVAVRQGQLRRRPQQEQQQQLRRRWQQEPQGVDERPPDAPRGVRLEGAEDVHDGLDEATDVTGLSGRLQRSAATSL